MTGWMQIQWRRQLWAVYLLVGALLTLIYVAVPPLKGSGPLINLLGLSSSLAIVAGLRMHRPQARAAWLFFVAGQFLFFSGDIYTYSYPKLLGADVPFPSIGDALYLAVYPALMAGLVLLVRRRNPQRDFTGVIDSLILTVGVALLSWVFLVAPNLHMSGLSPLAKFVSAAYPLGDVLLLAGAIRLAVDAGKRAPAFYLLVASIVSLLTVDSAYTYALLKDTYHHQLIYDVGWIAYYLLWGAAALHPSMRTLEEPAPDVRVRLTRRRLVLLAGACLIAPAIRIAQEWNNPDLLVVLGAAGALFMLVVTRMAGLVRQEERAVQREQALRTASAELVAAVGRQDVHQAAISGIHRLAGDDAAGRLVLLADDETVLVASTGGGAETPLGPETSTWLGAVAKETSALDSDQVPPAARAELRLGEGGKLLCLPLSVRDETRGLLMVELTSRVPSGLVQSLEGLAAQVSLAVEGAALAEDLHRRRSEARFGSLVAHSSDLITVLDAEGLVTYQSPSVVTALGHEVAEIESRKFEELLAPQDRPRLREVIASTGEAATETRAIECSLRHRDGTWLQFEVHHTNLLHDEHVSGIVLNSRDISERKAFEDQLAHQAFHDPVTNLANRALFADRVQHALTRASREDVSVGVMFIDLDDFKTVNDSLGHAAGDIVLQEVARRLEATVRPTDTVARFGGDEFAVLLDGVKDSQEAADVAGRILLAVEDEVDVEGKPVFPRASIGICLPEAGADSTDAEELLRNADVAMYKAKRDSKGSYRVFEPTMHELVLERLELRSELQRAIELDQLRVHYQPVVQLDQGEIRGVEALVRWEHPTRGLIPPGQFIPLAEETGLIVPIGRWVLQEACRQGAELIERFPRTPPLTMSVNLSVKQLQSDTILDDVREALELSGLPPAELVLEITESVMMADTDLAVERLNDLKTMGVRLAMDDFGTGYSSLSYLSRFPVDVLKMDRSFLASRQANSGLVAAMIALGDTLNLDVVAEGIETVEQIESLQEMGCEFGQGFHFARPMDEQALLAYLVRQSRFGEQPQSHAA